MSERTRKVSERVESKDSVSEAELVASKTRESHRQDDDIESILDEIDDVLEANAEDFVRNYVQKGGE